MKLIECPNCKDTQLKIILVNRFKKKHYYIIWCCNCDWSQKLNFWMGFLGDCNCFLKHKLEGRKPHFNEEELWKKGRLNDKGEE